MKSEKLLEEIGLIDDLYIAEADTAINLNPAGRSWLRWVGAAAALLVVAVAGTLLLFRQSADNLDLPMLTIGANTPTLISKGMMLRAFDVSELKSGNPWTEDANLKTLPVFKNTTVIDEATSTANGLSEYEMVQRAENAAASLGLTIESFHSLPERNPDTPLFSVLACCENIQISVDVFGIIQIIFPDTYGNDRSVTLPEEYTFMSGFGWDASELPVSEQRAYISSRIRLGQQDVQDATLYLLGQYADFVDMTSPAFAFSNIYGIAGSLFGMYSHSAYEDSGSLTQRMLNYSFNTVTFLPGMNNELRGIDRRNEDLSQRLGNYPIISVDEARELLLQKRCFATVEAEVPREEYIASVELIYYTFQFCEMYMPYYKFLVEMPEEEQENGFKAFGTYFVPAVSEQYITDMPLWDGVYNR